MWRRLADVLMRRPAPPNDERSIRKRQLDQLEREAQAQNRRIRAITVESRIGSYGRARLPR